jgi:hypothetical protein
MTRFAVATVLAAILAPLAMAQSRPPAPIDPPLPPPTPIVIPIQTAPPAAGYYKSGGRLVGADGYYPFDTGYYLKPGYEGLARSTGTFVMVPAPAAYGPPAPAIVESVVPVYSTGRGHFFHRR